MFDNVDEIIACIDHSDVASMSGTQSSFRDSDKLKDDIFS